MTFEQGNRKWAIEFHYETDRNRRVVISKLYGTGEQGEPETEHAGVAICAASDPFVKETGRKIALTRALEGHSKDFRRAAWQAYHGRKQDAKVS